MGKIEQWIQRLQPLLAHEMNVPEVQRLLLAHCGLPGPRGNLELAEAFARSLSAPIASSAWRETLFRWAAVDPREAPTGDPREFLAFCAVLSLGMLYGSKDNPGRQEQPMLEAVRRAASDPRWRLREAAAMALQHLGEGHAGKLRDVLDSWLAGDSPMEQRAALAALAHPPLLRSRALARFALQAGDLAMGKVARLPPERRRSEEFRVLVKGLSYVLSVFAAAMPKEGLALLERWGSYAGSHGDPVIRRIVASNLGKKRLRGVGDTRPEDSPRARAAD